MLYLKSRCIAGLAALVLPVLVLSGTAAQAQTILTTGNGIIRNSLCVGGDCQSGISFSDSTVILKENNTRIKFADTSGGSFPSGDWEIEANSSVNGGQSYLGFNDCGTGSVNGGCATDLVFAVETGAPTSALYVESDGDVGFGTSNPVVDLHAIDGNTPTLRLEQNTSSGFAAQTWDLAGNETNFFLRDVTNGSALPFRSRPGAPTSSIDIATDGDVGISTGSPTAQLHVTNADASDDGIRVTNSGTNANLMRLEATNATATGVGFIMDPGTGANFWQFTATANENIFRINRTAGNGTEFELNQNGNLTVTGSLFSGGGTCGGGCDRVFDADYAVPSIEQHAALMWSDGHLPAVGPTPENAPINVSDKLGRVLNELEHAHIYIEQLNAQLKAQGAEIEALKTLIVQ